MNLTEDKTLYLLANFTHQVINPLNGVLGTLDNILDGTIPQSKASKRLNSARGQLECTVSLVRNLAFFAQYTADYAKVAREKADKVCIIPQLLIEAAQFFQEQAQKKGGSIEIHEQWKQLGIKGNPDLIRQVFMNIFDNGVKYGLPDEKVEVNYWIKGERELIIEIFGRSLGFTSQEDIFELGVRGRAAKQATSSGTGLGLNICKLIVENVFQGRITAEHAKRSKITKFTIRFPDAFDYDKAH